MNILITGGSKRIGKEIAINFAKQGYNIILHYNTSKKEALLYFLVLKLIGEDIWGRPLLILAVLLIVVGVQFFSIGILYDLLMKTYFESQDKKPFRVRKVSRFDA